MKKLFCIAVFSAFIAGLTIGEIHGTNRTNSNMFVAGYDGAMNHVRSTIESRMPGLLPFYMADLGIRFVPRGNNIVALKFVSLNTNPEDHRTRTAADDDPSSHRLLAQLSRNTIR
ncbi:MAG TPA: hypothetical protein VHO84_15155 [Syntrophorhabdaceae bacterium]|nr:hypothetical protein [Syntrophorhabdaceae bacterium]